MVVRQEHEVFFRQAQKELQDFYRNSTLEYFPTSEHRAHAEFDAKSQGRTVKKHIDMIYRVKSGSLKGDEKIYFHETHRSTDHRGNRISKFIINGKYDRPIGLYQYDELRGDNICIGIDGFETVYQYPFDTKILDELVNSDEIDGDTKYAVGQSNGRMYSGFDYETFRNMPYEGLILFGSTGHKPEQQLQQQQERRQRQ